MHSQEYNRQSTFQDTLQIHILENPSRCTSRQLSIHIIRSNVRSFLISNRSIIASDQSIISYYDKYNYHSSHMIITLSSNKYRLYSWISNSKQISNIYNSAQSRGKENLDYLENKFICFKVVCTRFSLPVAFNHYLIVKT